MLTATKVSVNRKSLRPLNIFDNDEIDDNTLLTCVKKTKTTHYDQGHRELRLRNWKIPLPCQIEVSIKHYICA